MTVEDDVLEIFHVDDFYQVLGIPVDSDEQEIKKAYLKRSLEFHPDKIHDADRKDESKRKFQTISEVYKILSNIESRLDYDQRLKHSCSPCINSTAHDEVSIREFYGDDDLFFHDCRCSGKFILKRSQLATSSTVNIFIVDCDSCSNSVRVVV